MRNQEINRGYYCICSDYFRVSLRLKSVFPCLDNSLINSKPDHFRSALHSLCSTLTQGFHFSNQLLTSSQEPRTASPSHGRCWAGVNGWEAQG